MNIEYRFLQVLVSALADERVTVGLLFWDGSFDRFASNPDRVRGFSRDVGLVTQAVHEEVARLSKLSRLAHAPMSEELVRNSSGGVFQPIRVGVIEGATGFLEWSGVKYAEHPNPELLFGEWCQELNLLTPGIEFQETSQELSYDYTVERMARPGSNLVLQVLNLKTSQRLVLVFLSVEKDLSWHAIGQAFQDPRSVTSIRSPDGMFPSTPVGWERALEFASIQHD